MKYFANQGRISSFVVGRAGSEYGPPVAVYIQCSLQGKLRQSRPPRWAIGTGQLSCLQFRSGTIAHQGGAAV
ncbi:hypothetical protein [Desulfocicer vacuolatum]|uniref:hypothetical protein n=1 Tax=Desulfocicer vacuolatum TaxID=2298 RepID=UPI001BAED7E6|nr:hypothetical protein [Desulfocicer vacuolatum]